MKTIHLNFLGKDSVPDSRNVEISDEVYTILQSLTANKNPKDPLFPHADSNIVNLFLRAIMPDITVKNLRTVKANQEFIDETKRILKDFSPKTEIEKIRVIYLANKKVAEELNHQKNVAKNFIDQTEKIKEKIKTTEENSKKTMDKIGIQKLELQVQEEEVKRLFATQPKLLELKLGELKLKELKLVERELRTQKAIERANFNLEKKTGTKEIALGTSLGAYCDPRIVISICKEIDLDPNKIYTKKQLETFDYALSIDPNFWRSL